MASRMCVVMSVDAGEGEPLDALPTHIDVRLRLAKAKGATLLHRHRGRRRGHERGAARLPLLGTAVEERRAAIWECKVARLLMSDVTRSNGGRRT